LKPKLDQLDMDPTTLQIVVAMTSSYTNQADVVTKVETAYLGSDNARIHSMKLEDATSFFNMLKGQKVLLVQMGSEIFTVASSKGK
jgi:hypothetical protein